MSRPPKSILASFGDPMIRRADDDRVIPFDGEPGKVYRLLAEPGLAIHGKLAAVPDDPAGRTVYEAIGIAAGGARITVNTDRTVTIATGPYEVKVWAGAGREAPVSDPADPLYEVRHCNVQVERDRAGSAKGTGSDGLLIDAGTGRPAAHYEVAGLHDGPPPGPPLGATGRGLKLAELGDDVWIGDGGACDAALEEFELAVHVWREKDRHDELLCRRLREDAGIGLAIEWREAEPLEKMSIPIEDLAAYMARPGRLLIHGARGLCRTAHLGLIALMARGRSPWDAVAMLHRGMWIGWGVVPHVFPYPLDQSISRFRTRGHA